MDREAYAHGVTKSQTWLSDWAHSIYSLFTKNIKNFLYFWTMWPYFWVLSSGNNYTHKKAIFTNDCLIYNLKNGINQSILQLENYHIKYDISSSQFIHSVMYNSCDLMSAACQASLSTTNSRSLLRLKSIESVMPSNHLILCHSPSPPSFNLSQHQGLFK